MEPRVHLVQLDNERSGSRSARCSGLGSFWGRGRQLLISMARGGMAGNRLYRRARRLR